MSNRLIPARIADDVFAFTVASPQQAQALANHLRDQNMAEDIVAGLNCVAVRFHPARALDVETWLNDIQMPSESHQIPTHVHEIPIHYGGAKGPDLDRVCTALGLSHTAFIDLHTQPIHTVEMIGFTPGFSYISGLPDSVKIPRLSQPRSRVAAGSVGISSAFTGIYALSGPGGWPLIGRTEATLFDADSASPFRLEPGQRLQFRAV